jgi:4-carboxymuconolactone decarboxylase
MPRMPVLTRDQMDANGQRVYDDVKATTGRVGGGPSIAYAYAPELWEKNNVLAAYFENSSLSPAQSRLVAIMTVRHWNADFPWAAQARMALDAGLDPKIVEAVNARQQPDLTDPELAAIHRVADELLSSGTVSDATFKQAESTLGFRKLVDVVGTVGHYTKTAMMANVAGAEAPADAPSQLKQ